MTNKHIKLTIFGFFLIAVQQSYAGNTFEVKRICSDESGFDCNIYKYVDGHRSVILEGMKWPQVKKINDEIYQVSGSCGSPCQYHLFIGRKLEDATSEFIAVNQRNNCLIESDSKSMKVFSRTLMSKKRKLIANLNHKEYQSIIPTQGIYNVFQERSYFDQRGHLHLIALSDISSNGDETYFEKVFAHPCES